MDLTLCILLNLGRANCNFVKSHLSSIFYFLYPTAKFGLQRTVLMGLWLTCIHFWLYTVYSIFCTCLKIWSHPRDLCFRSSRDILLLALNEQLPCIERTINQGIVNILQKLKLAFLDNNQEHEDFSFTISRIWILFESWQCTCFVLVIKHLEVELALS